MDADWKSHKTPELINLLHEITLLHFKDFRSLYGSGNYRLAEDFKRYSVKGEYWQTFSEDKKEVVFDDFLKNKMKARYSHNKNKDTKQLVQSTYCTLTVPS